MYLYVAFLRLKFIKTDNFINCECQSCDSTSRGSALRASQGQCKCQLPCQANKLKQKSSGQGEWRLKWIRNWLRGTELNCAFQTLKLYTLQAIPKEKNYRDCALWYECFPFWMSIHNVRYRNKITFTDWVLEGRDPKHQLGSRGSLTQVSEAVCHSMDISRYTHVPKLFHINNQLKIFLGIMDFIFSNGFEQNILIQTRCCVLSLEFDVQQACSILNMYLPCNIWER